MPTVPIEENRVGIADVTGAKFQAADTSGTGLQALGHGVEQLGGAGSQAAEQLHHLENLYDDAAVKSGQNAYSVGRHALLHNGDNAYFNQSGFNAGNALKPTEDALTKLRTDTRAGLKSDRQRTIFDHVIGEQFASDIASVNDYAHGQVRVEQNTQSTGVRDNAAQDALDNFDDPEKLTRFIGTGTSAIDAQAAGQGHGSDWAKAEKSKYVSNIYARAIDHKAIADPVGAQAVYDAHRGDITETDRIAIEHGLHGPMMERGGEADFQLGSLAVAGVTEPPPVQQPIAGQGSLKARAVAITQFSESRNRDFAPSGKLLTSPAGAEGRMQVMPATQRDPGFGVTPARDHSPDELARVGRDYIGKMIDRYPGDIRKAWAANNWGPGNLDGAVAQYGNDWFRHAPKETRDYVTKNVAMLGSQGDVPFAPKRDDLGSVYKWIQDQPWDFDRKQAALSAADKHAARDDHLLNHQQDAAKDAAYGVINGLGENGFTSINQLPAGVRAALKPEALHALTGQAEQNAKPKAIAEHGPDALNLTLQSVYEPDKFKGQDLRLYAAKMAPAEFAELATKQATMRTKPNDAKVVSDSAIWSTITRYAPDLGLNLKNQDGKPVDETSRTNALKIRDMMKSDIDARTGGKHAPNSDEVKGAFDRAVMTVHTQQPGWLWGSTQVDKPRYEAVKDKTPYQVGIKPADRSRIVNTLRQAGNVHPSETDVGNMYVRLKGVPGYW